MSCWFSQAKIILSRARLAGSRSKGMQCEEDGPSYLSPSL